MLHRPGSDGSESEKLISVIWVSKHAYETQYNLESVAFAILCLGLLAFFTWLFKKD